MRILALRGNHNSGKSSTLNIVYELMILNGYSQLLGNFRVLGNPDQRDFFDVIVSKTNVKVGFVTMGDYCNPHLESVAALLAQLDALGCDVAICACFSRNFREVTTFPTPTTPVIIDKDIDASPVTQRFTNTFQANVIFGLV